MTEKKPDAQSNKMMLQIDKSLVDAWIVISESFSNLFKSLSDVTKPTNDDPPIQDEYIVKQTQTMSSLPLADRNRPWDSRAAERRVRQWAGGADLNWNKYWRAFFYRDETNPENFTSYKLQFADVIDGELVAVPRAIFAVAAALQGARGGVDISTAEQSKIKILVSGWYAKMRSEFQDDAILPPWEKREQKAVKPVRPIKMEFYSEFIAKQEDQRLVYGIVLEPDEIDAHGDFMIPSAIEKTAHDYMIKSQVVGNSHRKPAPAKIVESYIAPVDFEIGGQKVKKGSWVMVTKILDENMWSLVKKGEFTGYSVGGFGVVEDLTETKSK